MLFIRYIINVYLYTRYYFHRITGTGPFGRKGAIHVPKRNPARGNPLKSALARHHVKQFHEASCSVASVVTAVNAIRDGDPGRPDPITQMDILEKVRTGHWKERMSENGHNGRRGLPLTLLGEIVTAGLDAYHIQYEAVEIIRASRQRKPSKRIRQRLLSHLKAFEEKGNRLIIAHFDQGCFIPALNIPHISPVGGFDAKTQSVLILDVDPLVKTPYTIPFNTFYKGISSNYHHVFRIFGYQCGGCVVIRLEGGIRRTLLY